MTQPNMKKEYRAEVRSLNAKLRGIDRTIDKIHQKQKQRLAAFEREVKKGRAALRRDYDKTLRAVGRPVRGLLRRRSILEGRLS